MKKYKVTWVSVYGKTELWVFDTQKEAKEFIRKSLPNRDYHIEIIDTEMDKFEKIMKLREEMIKEWWLPFSHKAGRVTITSWWYIQLWDKNNIEWAKQHYSIEEICWMKSLFWSFLVKNCMLKQDLKDIVYINWDEYDCYSKEYWILKSSIETDPIQFILDHVIIW